MRARALLLALAAAALACAPRVTPPDPWADAPPPAERSATPAPVAAVSGTTPHGTPAPFPAATPPASLDRCGDVAEGPAPVGAIHTLRFLDVGQGDGALLKTASGKTVLIDAGDRDADGRILADLRAAGVDRIDLLMASHPHLDHIGGMRMVLDAFPVRLYVDPGTEHGTDTYRDLLLAVEARKVPYQVLRAGKRIELGDEAVLSVLSPGDTLINSRRSDENANSLVVRLAIGSFDVLFTGDAEPETLEALIASGVLDASPIEVLKVAHHGSRHGTSRAFLDELRPRVAVISVGAGNDYGHPHPETLQVLADDCVRTYRTDRDGVVTIRTDGTGFRVTAAKGTTPEKAVPGTGPKPDLARADGGTKAKKTGDAWTGSVFASSRGKVYHPAGCPHINRIKQENLVEYSSADEAVAAGLRAGKGCRPGASDSP